MTFWGAASHASRGVRKRRPRDDTAEHLRTIVSYMFDRQMGREGMKGCRLFPGRGRHRGLWIFLFILVCTVIGSGWVHAGIFRQSACQHWYRQWQREPFSPLLSRRVRACATRALISNALLRVYGGRGPLALVLVSPLNDPSMDTLMDQTFQSEPRVVLAPPIPGDPNALDDLLVTFWDDGSYPSSPTFTGWSRSLDGGITWDDRGAIPVPAGFETLPSPPELFEDETTATVHLLLPVVNTTTSMYQLLHLWTADRGTVWNSEFLLSPSSAPYSPVAFVIDNGPGSTCVGCRYLVTFDPSGGQWIMIRQCPGDPSWSAPVSLTLLHPSCDSAPRMAVDGQGRLYVLVDDAGCRGCPDHALELIYSDDCGNTWFPTEPIEVVCYTPPAETGPSNVCSTDAVPGNIQVPLGHSIAACPLTTMQRVLVAFHADSDGHDQGDVGDVFIMQSNDGGLTWFNPISGCTPMVPLGCPADPEPDGIEIGPVIAYEPLGCALLTWYKGSGTPAARWSIQGRVTCDGTWLDFPTAFRVSDQFEIATGFSPNRPVCDAGLGINSRNEDALTWQVVWTDYGRTQDPGPHRGPRPDADIGYAHFLWNAGDVARLDLDGFRLDGDADGDGALEPCEQANLWITLKNVGRVSLTGVQGNLSVNSPDVTLVAPTADFPDLIPGATGENLVPFQIQLSQAHRCGAAIPFQLNVSTDQGGFTLQGTLKPGDSESVLYAFTFNQGAEGWVATDTGCGITDNLWHAIGSGVCEAWTGQVYFGQDGVCHYDRGSRVCGAWVSPVLDLSGSGTLDLEIHYRLKTDGTGDFAAIQVSLDGGNNWLTIADNGSTGGLLDDDQYHRTRFSLDAYQQTGVLIRFVFDSQDSTDNLHRGWLIDDVRILRSSCNACQLTPVSVRIDDQQANASGVWEPGESVQIIPAWANATIVDFPSITGVMSSSDMSVTFLDSDAAYGDIPAGVTVDCSAMNNCYAASVGINRPSQHWDLSVQEDLSHGEKTNWLLHVGLSFTDVPVTHPFYRFIETLFHHGITQGCQPGLYCPRDAVRPGQMAAFLARAIYGSSANIPTSGTINGQLYDCINGPTYFTDVPAGSIFCAHIHAIAALGITNGCAPNRYCPADNITRGQMAVFLARALLGDDSNIPVQGTVGNQTYDCVNGPSLFADVPVGSPFCRHIHYIYSQGITSGCGSGKYCPRQPASRGQMAVFLVRTFNLMLYPGTPIP